MISKTALAAALLLASAGAGAASPNPFMDQQWALSWFGSRMVGTYHTDGQVRPCGSTLPFQPVVNTMSFNSGGTVVENARFPPAGVQNAFGLPGLFTRGVGLGSWTYNPRTHKHTMSLRFDFFIDGVYAGTGTVDRDISLSSDGNSASGAVQSALYDVNGSVLRKLCGTATSTRL